MDGFWFKSSLFSVESDEDSETNPGRYGRQLADWLKVKFEQRGYDIESVIAEDWGRCLMVSRDPFLLWVGCGNVDSEANEPLKGDIVWHCFVAAEVPFLKRIFGKPDTTSSLSKLHHDLHEILQGEPEISLVDEP
jgi:hypothetical protein